MPLSKSCSLAALKLNIAELIDSGHSRDQAVAIANQTLRDACSEGRQEPPAPSDISAVAKEFKRSRGERSTDYLEAALSAAKQKLSHRDFSVLHQSARASAGGRASARNRFSSIEKACLLGPDKLSKSEKDDALERLREMAAAEERYGIVGVAIAKSLSEWVNKGFSTGTGDAGAHAHGLMRKSNKTQVDGDHVHWFKMPGTGRLICTSEDGAHEHEIAEGGLKTKTDGKHSHRIYLDGGEFQTDLSGGHYHELMFETSSFDSNHTHDLKLADGTVLTSFSIENFLAEGPVADSQPLPSSSRILNAINRAAYLEAQLDAMMQIQTKELPGTAVAMVSMTEAETADGHRFAVDAKDFDVEPGDIVNVAPTLSQDLEVVSHSLKSTADTWFEVSKSADAMHTEMIAKAEVPFTGPETAPLVFIAGSPSPLEIARGQGLVGQDGVAFANEYLKPLGLTKSDVAVGFAVPRLITSDEVKVDQAWLAQQVAKFPGAKLIALGKRAKEALGPAAFMSLPHPTAVRSGGARFTEQVTRKVRALTKILDSNKSSQEDIGDRESRPGTGHPGNLAGAVSELRTAGQVRVRISKAADEKQIVYGVVLDPYVIDTQEDWVPPAEIESTAHGFIKKSRVIGVEHLKKANAELVESFVVPYPTQRDYKAALKNLPHKAYVMPYGEDKVHSGSWVAGVQLGDREWEAFKKGEFTGFSIGGFSFKSRVPLSTMPKVEFVELEPVI